jgi:uncharacterized membrane protein YbhN (UPF0104 family)
VIRAKYIAVRVRYGLSGQVMMGRNPRLEMMRLQNAIKWFLVIVGVLLAVWVLSRELGREGLAQAIGMLPNLSPKWLAVALILQIAGLLIQAAILGKSYHMLGYTLRFGQAALLNLASTFIARLTALGPVAFTASLAALGRRFRLPNGSGVSAALVFYYWLYTAAALLSGGSCTYLLRTREAHVGGTSLFAVAAVAGILGLVATIAGCAKPHLPVWVATEGLTASRKILSRKHPNENTSGGTALSRIRWNALKSRISNRDSLFLLAACVLVTLTDASMLYCVVSAFGTHPYVGSLCAWYFILSTAASLTPIPSGIGVRVASVSFALNQAGIPGPLGASAAMVHRLLSFWLPASYGAAMLFAFQKGTDPGSFIK